MYLEFLFTSLTATSNFLVNMESSTGSAYQIVEYNGALSFSGNSLCSVLQNKWYAIAIIADNLATK